jgi:SAM-dependent methyltransferase
VSEIYKKKPMECIEGVPVFSARDKYSENYERIAADHVRVFEKEGRNPFQAERVRLECERSTIDLVKHFSNDGDTVLDVGCGMGTLLDQFANLRRYGMDISLAYLRYASAKGLEVCWARIEDMPYCENLFDVVTCTDVLEHVLDLNACFSKILSVVKPGGTIIVRVPYKEDLRPYLDPEFPYEWVHLRQFDEFGLRLFVEKIFRCSVVTATLSGYRAGLLRSGSITPRVGAVLNLFLTRLENATPLTLVATSRIRRSVFLPTVLNLVVRKPTID